MTILVVGGTGFLGRHVARCLHDAGQEVVVFHRGQTSADLPPAVRHINGERRRLNDFAEEFRRLAPAVVIDIIPYTEQDALDVMCLFRGIARRLVAVSSGDVYRNYDGLRRIAPGLPSVCPLNEDAPLRENLYPYRQQASGPEDWLYDYEKILVERVVLGEPQLPGTVLRLPMVYGPGDRQHRLFAYLKRIDDGRPVLLDARQATWRCTRGYVENVAAAIACAAADDRAAGQVYNVGEVDALTEAEWVAAIGRATASEAEVVAVPPVFMPKSLAPDLDWQYHLAMDTSRIREQLGFVESVSRDEALQRTVEWERTHPPGDIKPDQFDYAAESAALAAMRLGKRRGYPR
jgi:nucleoside-diphosphate-sugar epimerase